MPLLATDQHQIDEYRLDLHQPCTGKRKRRRTRPGECEWMPTMFCKYCGRAQPSLIDWSIEAS